MKKNILLRQHSRWTWILLIILLCSGCASPRGWAYKGLQPLSDRSPILGKSVAVVPFTDSRPIQNSNNALLYLIPLMPYGWQELNTPETVDRHLASGLWQFKPTEDIAKAVASEISNRRIFKEAFFTYSLGTFSTAEVVFVNRAARGQVIVYGDGHAVLHIQLQPMFVDTNPFLFRGKVCGAMVRLSATPIVNVTSGGGETGFFVIDDAM